MASDTTAGFKIGDAIYPFPESVSLGDAVLVHELIGLSSTEFAERIDALRNPDPDDPPDMLAVVGLVGVAVWHAHPRWKREKVVQFVQQVEFDSFAIEGGDDTEEVDADPQPHGAADPSRSPDSFDESTITPAAGSEWGHE